MGLSLASAEMTFAFHSRDFDLVSPQGKMTFLSTVEMTSGFQASKLEACFSTLEMTFLRAARWPLLR